MYLSKSLLFLLLILVASAGNCQHATKIEITSSESSPIKPGAYLTVDYLPWLKSQNIGIVANNTSLINSTHLVDTLISLGIKIEKIFGPEHGFRGNEPDGKEISSTTDSKTGLPLISLYGDHKKPTKADLQNIDIMLFDIQDVGVRFYTYISTLTYLMEACAENNIPLILLDRPNPNGFYIDGPVLDTAFSSFVGLHPVPVVYGMTIGEYATMINNEGWLKNQVHCNLKVIECANYTHTSRYSLPVSPSPNLQDMKAVYLYPSLCFFEGTVVSVGRGTDMPFRIFGHPLLNNYSYTFTPEPIKGVSENPPLKGQKCYGLNLDGSSESIKKHGQLELRWLLETYKILNNKTTYFLPYFDKLAGTDQLRNQIIAGKSEAEIRKSWIPAQEKFRKIRQKYLLYPDFE